MHMFFAMLFQDHSLTIHMFFGMLFKDHSLTMHLFFGILCQKNFANLPFILLTLFNLALLLPFLIYPHLNFTPSLKLLYSTNHFLLSLFHTLTSFLWLSWPGFRFSISHSFSLYHPQPFRSPALRPILMYTVSGNEPPSIYYGWLCRHFNPHVARHVLLTQRAHGG